MDKDRWLAISLDDLNILAKAGGIDLRVMPSEDSEGPMDATENPLGTPGKDDLLQELAVCAFTRPPEEFVVMIDANMEGLIRLSHLTDEVSDILVEGLRLGVSKKCGDSANMLGALFYDGLFVEQDFESAAELYELGSDWGNIQATVNLGYIYEYGRLGACNYEKAYQCYSLAASLAGSSEALCKMGDLFSRGKGVEKNRMAAVRLWKQALHEAYGGPICAQAAIRLAPLYLKGDPEADISQDALYALELYQEAEIGLRQDIARGMTYYEKRLKEAIQGQSDARNELDQTTIA